MVILRFSPSKLGKSTHGPHLITHPPPLSAATDRRHDLSSHKDFSPPRGGEPQRARPSASHARGCGCEMVGSNHPGALLSRAGGWCCPPTFVSPARKGESTRSPQPGRASALMQSCASSASPASGWFAVVARAPWFSCSALYNWICLVHIPVTCDLVSPASRKLRWLICRSPLINIITASLVQFITI
jgi:hypothetical protein